MTAIDYDGLVERLNSEDCNRGRYDREAATAIQTLRAELADRDARLAEAEKVLTYYADTYCEGFGECVGDFCGKLSGDNCGGCPARAFLAKQEPSQ